ncbi:MAG TPA: histidine kinase [Burkholderiaceae bacterium]|nr:histidine kinase [Burkholderiaceae bacterium]HQR71129.1 histidine kinase [Burkholderiaceae bacterium]
MTESSWFRRMWSGSTLVRVGVVLSVVAMLSLSVIVAATIFAEQSTGKASAINIAGSLRMQSYALSTRVADTRGSAVDRREAAEAAIVEFERRLKSPSLMAGIPDDGSNPVHRIYSSIVHDWESRIKPLARQAIDNDEARADFLARIPDFVGRVDILVRQIETDLEGRIQQLRLVLGIGFFVMMLLVVAALFLLNVEVFQPIARLAEVAKQVRTGDFSVHAESTGPDEIGQLGQAFNFMVDDLARLYGSLEKQVAEKTRDLERRNESLSLLYETTRMLAEKPVDAESLKRVLAIVRQAVGVEGGLICSIHADSARGLPLARDESSVSACAGVDCRACADGSRVTWRTEPGETGERRVLGIPLVDGGISYGVMPLVLSPGKGLETWQMELAETMGRHVGAALASAERREEHRRLGVLEERAAIARELHDSLAQSLSYTKIQIARLSAALEDEGDRVQSAAVLAELREGVNSAYRELRELLTTFRLGLSEEGFQGTLADSVASFERRSGVRSVLVNDLLAVELSANEQVHVLQIVREALTNVEHHARARHIWVSLRRAAGNDIEVSIEDDGIGVGDGRAAHGHFGLAIMRDRAASVGGVLTIEERAPQGTRVRLRFKPQTAFAGVHGPTMQQETAT